jgi:hypothetical protein
MGMFTHLGIGWELCWMIVIGMYTALLIYYGSKGVAYKPSSRTKILTCSIAWGFPILWWTVIGLSVDAYDNSSGYFCWVKFSDPVISLLFAGLPIIVCCILVTCCYGYVAVSLLWFSRNKVTKDAGARNFSKEIKRALLYIFVYCAWVHPYLAFTLITMTGGVPSRGLWLYFLAMINSMGLLNFLAYGHTEEWFSEVRFLCGCGTDHSNATYLRKIECASATKSVAPLDSVGGGTV